VADSPRTITAEFQENVCPMGTPEWWLASHGLTNAAPEIEETGDSDGDGMPAWAEYVADTDPTNKASALRITGIRPGGSGMEVDWAGGTGAWQYLENRTRLDSGAEPWICIYTGQPPTAVTNSALDTAATNRSLFYRIRAERRP